MIYQRTRIKNARKAAILGALARHVEFQRGVASMVRRPGLTYAEVAGLVGIYPVRQVARDLQRYAMFHYVRRWRAAGRFRYRITTRGLERLAWFRSQLRSRKP